MRKEAAADDELARAIEERERREVLDGAHAGATERPWALAIKRSA